MSSKAGTMRIRRILMLKISGIYADSYTFSRLLEIWLLGLLLLFRYALLENLASLSPTQPKAWCHELPMSELDALSTGTWQGDICTCQLAPAKLLH